MDVFLLPSSPDFRLWGGGGGSPTSCSHELCLWWPVRTFVLHKHLHTNTSDWNNLYMPMFASIKLSSPSLIYSWFSPNAVPINLRLWNQIKNIYPKKPKVVKNLSYYRVQFQLLFSRWGNENPERNRDLPKAQGLRHYLHFKGIYFYCQGRPHPHSTPPTQSLQDSLSKEHG